MAGRTSRRPWPAAQPRAADSSRGRDQKNEHEAMAGLARVDAQAGRAEMISSGSTMWTAAQPWAADSSRGRDRVIALAGSATMTVAGSTLWPTARPQASDGLRGRGLDGRCGARVFSNAEGGLTPWSTARPQASDNSPGLGRTDRGRPTRRIAGRQQLDRITAIDPGKKRQKNDPLRPRGSKRIAIPRRGLNSQQKPSAHAIAEAFTRSRTRDEFLAIFRRTATSSSYCKSMA